MRFAGMALLCVLVPTAALAQDGKARAEALFQDGKALMAKGDYMATWRFIEKEIFGLK